MSLDPAPAVPAPPTVVPPVAIPVLREAALRGVPADLGRLAARVLVQLDLAVGTRAPGVAPPAAAGRPALAMAGVPAHPMATHVAAPNVVAPRAHGLGELARVPPRANGRLGHRRRPAEWAHRAAQEEPSAERVLPEEAERAVASGKAVLRAAAIAPTVAVGHSAGTEPSGGRGPTTASALTLASAASETTGPAEGTTPIAATVPHVASRPIVAIGLHAAAQAVPLVGAVAQVVLAATRVPTVGQSAPSAAAPTMPAREAIVRSGGVDPTTHGRIAPTQAIPQGRATPTMARVRGLAPVAVLAPGLAPGLRVAMRAVAMAGETVAALMAPAIGSAVARVAPAVRVGVWRRAAWSGQ